VFDISRSSLGQKGLENAFELLKVASPSLRMINLDGNDLGHEETIEKLGKAIEKCGFQEIEAISVRKCGLSKESSI